MKANNVKLSDVCEVSDGTHYTPPNTGGPFPFLTVKDMTDEGLSFSGCSYVSGEEFEKAKKAGACPEPGVVLFSKDGTVGKVHVVRNDRPFAALSSIALLRPDNDQVASNYLGFAMRSPAILKDAVNRKTGSALQRIILADLKEVSIPMPDLSEQRRIAGELERADGLRRTRRYALELADAFLPAAFIQLFGDLIHNERKWEFRELDEMADIASGIAKGQKYGDRQTREVPYLRVANVQDGFLNLAEIKTIQALLEDIEHLRLQKDDIVMTEGGDFDKLGRGAIWPGGIKDCIHQNHIFRVRLDQTELLPQFFAAFLRSPCAKHYFLRCSKQTTNLASINMTQLRATPTPVPPLSLQTRFAELVERHERLRSVQRESLRQAEHLFQSLLHNAFTT